MHLREMTFYEIRNLIKRADFSKFGIVLIGSRNNIVRLFSKDGKISTAMYFNIMIMVEGIIRYIPGAKNRLKEIRIASRLGFFPNIFVVATK